MPDKVIRYRFDEETIKELLELKWWDYNLAGFGELDLADVKGCMSRIMVTIASGTEKYSPKPIMKSDIARGASCEDSVCQRENLHAANSRAIGSDGILLCVLDSLMRKMPFPNGGERGSCYLRVGCQKPEGLSA